ncbi:MAG: adenine phosphoribosyltransferase [Oscillospiraceae bacterium]|nr:adenine phosphoribosyltransferase [Oscillospiraceae bacterium]MBQ9959488.1 adenine phosphoribosyltransferase [Oscillospiraceae bacterium]
MEYYELHVAGLTRQLPICKVNDEISFAAFIMFSDVELTVATAEALLKKCPEFDVIVTAEAKGIPLAYEMSRQCGKKYIVARKMSKLYMHDPIEVEVKSISTAKKQTLWLDRNEMDEIKGKRVLIVDDVISTGGSLLGLEALVNRAEGEIVGKATVLAEGEAADRPDLIYLEVLPVFANEA